MPSSHSSFSFKNNQSVTNSDDHMASKKPVMAVALCLSVALGLSACGGDRKINEGRFIDSPVQGAEWVSGELNGTTDVNGTFSYRGRDTVRFSIGAVELGEVEGGDVITPLDLVGADSIDNAQVLNMVRLLLSLDADGIPSNGIEITAQTRSAATLNIDFSLPITEFQDDSAVMELVNAAQLGTDRQLTIVSAEDARAHFEGTLQGLQVDLPPVANAGPDQQVLAEETVYLCGRVSDADNAIVDFDWQQLSPEDRVVTLERPSFENDMNDMSDTDSTDSDQPSMDDTTTTDDSTSSTTIVCDEENQTQFSTNFQAPSVTVETTFEFEFAVEDATGLTATDVVQVVVSPLL
jgi:hypothetical protein